MDNRKRPGESSSSGGLVFWSSPFQRQPAQVLIVEALPPWWSETRPILSEALDNFFSLACCLDGPCRVPLLSLYAISRQQECLLPFVQVRGNFTRLHSSVEELRSITGEGCVRGSAGGTDLLRQAVLDSLQQFKQHIRHTNSGSQSGNNLSVEKANETHALRQASVLVRLCPLFPQITVVTSQPGRHIVHRLEMGLKDIDLVSLKRLLVVQICNAEGFGDEPPPPPPEALATDFEDSLMLGAEIDLKQVENSVVAMESVLKVWLHEYGGDREHLHILLPTPHDNLIPVCVKCDMQERLISPALIPLVPTMGGKTEGIRDFLPVIRASANQGPPPQKLKAIKALRAEGVCESVLYGLPLVIRPTTCWQLDWDEMETNHGLFHALCHTLRSRDLFLLLQVESTHKPGAGGLYSHYVLQPSQTLSLLLKPVVCRELLLPCTLPVSTQDPIPQTMQTIEGCLSQLEEDFVLNPLSLRSHLYSHLRSRGLVSQTRYPYRLQSAVAHKYPPQPADGARSSSSRQPRQPHSQGRQLGTNSKVRATVAPLPSSSHSACSSSTMGPPPAKASRPALNFRSSSSSSSRCRHPPPAQPRQEEDSDCGENTVIIL